MDTFFWLRSCFQYKSSFIWLSLRFVWVLNSQCYFMCKQMHVWCFGNSSIGYCLQIFIVHTCTCTTYIIWLSHANDVIRGFFKQEVTWQFTVRNKFSDTCLLFQFIQVIRQVSCGAVHVVALSEEGLLQAWGNLHFLRSPLLPSYA